MSQQQYKELVAITFGDKTQTHIICPHQHPISVVAKFKPELLLNLSHTICEDRGSAASQQQ